MIIDDDGPDGWFGSMPTNQVGLQVDFLPQNGSAQIAQEPEAFRVRSPFLLRPRQDEPLPLELVRFEVSLVPVDNKVKLVKKRNGDVMSRSQMIMNVNPVQEDGDAKTARVDRLRRGTVPF